MKVLSLRNNPLLYIGVGLALFLCITVFGAHRVGAAGYSDAMAEAQSWCDTYDNSPWPYAVSGYGWISARGDGTNITVEPGQQTAEIQINFAGRHCKKTPRSYVLYMDGQTATINGGSNLLSGQRKMVSDPSYNHNQPSNYWQRANATLDVSGLSVGSKTYQVCMHWIPQPSYIPDVLTDVTTTCNDITINKKSAWTINGQSYIRKSTDAANSQGTIKNITPGTRLYWSHDLRASEAMDQSISYRVDKSGFSNGWNTQNSSTSARYLSGNSLFVKVYPPNDAYTVYDIQQSDVGNTLCQRISWTPNSWNDSNRGEAKYIVNGVSLPTACAEVPYNFNLVPSIDQLSNEFGDQGGTIPTVSGKITNQGPTKSYVDIKWQLSTVIVKPGGNIEEVNGVDDRKDGCAYYGNTCTSIDGRGSGEGDSSFDVKATVVQQLLNQQIGDLEVGSKLCYGMSVKAYKPGLTNATPEWRHSPAECVIVGKKPKVQVWGGDLTVGRRFSDDISTPKASGVDVSVSVKENGTKTYGSWVEYGVFASAAVTGGSSAGLAGPDGNASSLQSSWSKLTFANSGHTGGVGGSGCVAEKFGCYNTATSMGSIPDVATRLAPGKVTDTPQAPVSGPLDNLSGTYYAAGNVAITGGSIAKGKSVVIKAAGTVRISGDIHYTTDPLTSIDEIPQVVIIANNIIIDEGVTNVDAWLVANGANGSIYTCGDFRNILTSKMCDKQLTINGPIMSKKLFLQRTAGSGTDTASGDPAEVLNLRTDAYLWAISRSGGAGGIQTISTSELAPRF